MKEAFLDFIKSELTPRTLVITCGLPATGKTPAAEIMSKEKNLQMLRTDLIRLELLRDEDIFDNKVASDMKKRDLVYKEMFSRAQRIAENGNGIVMDATFITQDLRKRAAGIAENNNMLFVVLETRCPEKVCLRRIGERTKEAYESNAVNEQAYINNKKRFEKVNPESLKKIFPFLNLLHILVDTGSDNVEDWFVVKSSGV